MSMRVSRARLSEAQIGTCSGAITLFGASVRTAPIVQRTLVPFGHDGVFETGRTGGVILVHDAVIHDAEADGDASRAEQASFDGRVATSSLDSVLNVVEGVRHPLGARAVSDGFAGLVSLVEVLESSEPGGVDRGLQVRGPGTVGVRVALGRAVGQCN
jgi:hypothetical protein